MTRSLLRTPTLKGVAEAVAKSRRYRTPAPDAHDAKTAREVAQRIMLRRQARQQGDYRGRS